MGGVVVRCSGVHCSALRCVALRWGKGGRIIVGLTVRPTLLAVQRLRECCSIRWGSSTSGLPRMAPGPADWVYARDRCARRVLP